jgi:hypothetical protein
MADVQTMPVPEGPKEQPWKAFWPRKANEATAEELKKMPWLNYEPDPEKPDVKPWYSWMRNDERDPSGIISRRGAN